MSSSYYYFAASLPALQFKGKLPFTVNEFLMDGSRLLSQKDFRLLESLLKGQDVPVRHPLVAKVFAFELGLKNHIAVYRARKFNKDPQASIRGAYAEDPQLVQWIKEAASAADPLEGDRIITKARWQFYDQLMVGQFFNLAYILLYGLQLKIIERYYHIASPRGREIYEQLKNIEFPSRTGVGFNV